MPNKITPLIDTNLPDWAPLHVGGAYRFVNHDVRLATTGFLTHAALMKYSGLFLATDSALASCRKRYEELFPEISLVEPKQ